MFEVAVSIPDGVIGIFFIDMILPGVDSASNRNEYQEYSLRGGGKGGRCVTLTCFIVRLS